MYDYSLQNSINWALPYIQYSPLTAGTAGESAVSTATLIRNSLLSPPLTWAWNRSENSSKSTLADGTQDYVIDITDFGFIEKVYLTDAQGGVFEVKDVYNNLPLSGTTSTTNARSRPLACSVMTVIPGQSIKIRFMQVPDKVYKITVIYQIAAVSFTPNTVSSVANAAGVTTTYTGVFTPSLFTAGRTAMILGFSNRANNGSFVIVSCTSTALVVNNSAGVAQSGTAYAINSTWSPIPDYYSDIYNWLFLSEAFSLTDDNKSQVYRQRGVAAFIAKSEGLTETQKNAFIQQWGSYQRETQTTSLNLQQGTQGRGV